MRSVSAGKCMVWAILLSWPWVLWAVARNSPEMIVKGIADSATVGMPIVADAVLIFGGVFALYVRRNTLSEAAAVRDDSHLPRPHSHYRERDVERLRSNGDQSRSR